MKHKTTFYRVVCAIALSLLSPLSHAYDFEVDGNFYTLISTSERTVAFAGTNNSGDLMIPETVTFSGKTLTVIDIEKGAFKGTDVKSVTIPRTVVNLRDYAMMNGTFEKVTLPNNMESIGSWAFAGCENLKSINIPPNIIYIAEGTFSGCTNLYDIRFPNSLIYIFPESFFDCKSLKKLRFPKKINALGYYRANWDSSSCFAGCSSLDSIIIDDSNSAIGMAQQYSSHPIRTEFEGCLISFVYVGRNIIGITPPDYSSWARLYLPNFKYVKEVVYGDSCTSMLYSYSYYYHYTTLKEDSTNLFSSSALEQVTLGKNLDKIYSYSKNDNLKNVYVRATFPQIAEGFSNYAYLYGKLYVPRGTLKAYQEADVWKEFWNIEEYDVPEYPTDIRPVSVQEDNVLVGIYDINGIKHDTPVKGLNIYRYKDGRAKKKFVK